MVTTHEEVPESSGEQLAPSLTPSDMVHLPITERPGTPEEQRLQEVLEEVGGDIEELAKRYVQVEAEADILAHNEATGLEGAVRLNQHLTQKLHEAALNNGKVGIMFVDLKGLKRLNEIFGHPGADGLLRVVGEWLLGKTRQTGVTDDGTPREKDKVFHLHGDEFVGVLDGYKLDDEDELDRRAKEDEEDLENALQAKIATMERRSDIDDSAPIVTGVNVALVYSNGDESAKEVLTRASLKCSAQKREEENRDPVYKEARDRTQTSQQGFISMLIMLLILITGAIIVVYWRVQQAR